MTEKKDSRTRQTYLGKQKSKWVGGVFNKVYKDHQEVRITEGCTNQCPFCYEPEEIKIFEIPRFVRKKVKIFDMNLLCKKEALSIIYQLGDERVDGMPIEYELICGIDYRFLTEEIAEALMVSRFVKPRLAWDFDIKDQYKIKDALELLLKVGYKRKDIMIFMLCNWLIPYTVNCMKLDLCKVWNVMADDNYFDGQQPPNVIPIHWKSKEIEDFKARVKLHNQMIKFHIYPDLKRAKRFEKHDRK